MKRIAIPLAMLIAIAWAVASAQPPQAPRTSPSPEQAEQANFFAGVVTAVNAKSKTLTVAEAGRRSDEPERRMTFTIQPDTKLEKNGSATELSQIKPGNPVSLTYETQGKQNLVRTLEVLTTPT